MSAVETAANAVSLSGRTVIVVGVGPGLGAEVARLALRDGADVVVAARNAERLNQAAKELDPTGDHILAVPTDVTDRAAVSALVEQARQRFGRVDALVPVAAYDTLMGGLSETNDDDWHEVLDTNLVAAMHAVEAAVDAMPDGGSVVFIGTQSTVRPPAVTQLGYAASKGGLQAAMYHLAHELGPRKIRLNMVVATWMWGPVVIGYLDSAAESTGVDRQELIDQITVNMPLGEIPADEDVAEAVVWLCSDRARMVTGQTLYVNAGEHLH